MVLSKKAVISIAAFLFFGTCTSKQEEEAKSWDLYHSKLNSMYFVVDSLFASECDSSNGSSPLCIEMEETKSILYNRRESISIISSKKHDQEARQIIEADLDLVIDRAESDIQYFLRQIKK